MFQTAVRAFEEIGSFLVGMVAGALATFVLMCVLAFLFLRDDDDKRPPWQ